MKAVFAVGLIAVMALGVPQVRAEEDDLVCAEVVACEKDGTVQAPFDQGPCADKYRLQCLSLRVNELTESLISCQEQASTREEDLKRMITRLRVQLRDLRRRG